MPPQSRGGSVPPRFLSRSTPNLPTSPSAEAPQQTGHLLAPPPRRESRLGKDFLSNDELLEASSLRRPRDESEESGNGNSEEEAMKSSPSRSLHISRSHDQLPRHKANTLFPPYYNRPPTPLPPSPSFTSLLRPSFASTTSRQTTPDSSDAEASVRSRSSVRSTAQSSSSTTKLANSARHAPTVPRASPKVPTYEYYGFAVYLGSSAAFVMYILWAYLPAPMLHQLGIHYYPNRWWALAIPCWLIVLILYIYTALASYNTGHLTLPLDSLENLVDECAQIAVVDRKTGQIVRDPVLVTDKLHEKDKEKGTHASGICSSGNDFSAYHFHANDEVDWKGLWSTGTDAVMDVPIGGVCEVLYGD